MTESAEQSLNRKRVNHASPSRGGIFSRRPGAGMINVLQRDRMGRRYRAIVNARGRASGPLGWRESNGDRLAALFVGAQQRGAGVRQRTLLPRFVDMRVHSRLWSVPGIGIGRASADRHRDAKERAEPPWGRVGMASALKSIDDIAKLVPPPANDGDGYRPSPDEPFMNPRQQDYFRDLLQAWKEAILREAQGTISQLQADSLREADLTDRASSETDWSIELRTRDRQRKLIAKIDAAIRRIDEGEYGYCEVTGEPISIARLEARPIATMTVEAQERHERQEKVSRED